MDAGSVFPPGEVFDAPSRAIAVRDALFMVLARAQYIVIMGLRSAETAAIGE